MSEKAKPLLILIFIYIFLKYCFFYVSPFLVAYLIAKVITKIHAQNRMISILIYFVLLILLFSIITLLIYLLYQSLKQFYFELPHLISITQKLLSNEPLLKQFSAQISFVLSWLMQLISSLILLLPKTLGFLVLVMMLTFLFILDIHAIARVVKKLTIEGYQACYKIQNIVFENLKFMMIASFKLFLITWLECLIGMFLIGIDKFVLISFVCACFDSMPFIGIGLVLLPYTFFLYLNGQSQAAIGLIILYSIMNTIRFFLEPKIVSKQLNIPLLLHFSMMVLCTRLFGGIGFLYSPFLCLGLTLWYKNQKTVA